MSNKLYTIYNKDCIRGAVTHLKDESVDLLICDPPFGIKEHRFGKQYQRKSENIIGGYVPAPDDYYKFNYEWIEQAKRIMKPNATMFIVSGWSKMDDIAKAVKDLDLVREGHLIWKFNFGVYCKTKFISSHYHIFCVAKKGADIKDNNIIGNTSVLFINKEYQRGKKKNINKLPEKLVELLMMHSSDEGNTVCDFFMGNGTTASVALRLGRKVKGFELNKEAYQHFMPLLKEVKPVKIDLNEYRKNRFWAEKKAVGGSARYRDMEDVWSIDLE